MQKLVLKQKSLEQLHARQISILEDVKRYKNVHITKLPKKLFTDAFLDGYTTTAEMISGYAVQIAKTERKIKEIKVTIKVKQQLAYATSGIIQ